MSSLLGAQIVDAHKRPLQTPQREWLRGPLREWADACIADAVEQHGDSWLRPEAVRAAWRRYCEGESDNSFFVWQWVTLGPDATGPSCSAARRRVGATADKPVNASRPSRLPRRATQPSQPPTKVPYDVPEVARFVDFRRRPAHQLERGRPRRGRLIQSTRGLFCLGGADTKIACEVTYLLIMTNETRTFRGRTRRKTRVSLGVPGARPSRRHSRIPQ